ncbi:hypothetical protein FJZ18_00965 [Candidatus Pacearchaeota archaeon]|nr:hypothetical protein [Candidatus Pacearchaeota archaeon]
MRYSIFKAGSEEDNGLSFLAELAQEALLSTCPVQMNDAITALKRSYHPNDEVQLWTVRHCQDGVISADFIHYVSPDECKSYNVRLGQVSDEYSHKMDRARVIQVGTI